MVGAARVLYVHFPNITYYYILWKNHGVDRVETLRINQAKPQLAAGKRRSKKKLEERIGSMVETIMKRDGRTVEFKQEKIAEAVERAFQACGAMQDRAAAEDIAQRVVDKLESGAIEGAPTVEGVQDLVEETLIESGFVQTAKSYILYRAERSRSRDVNSRLIQTLKDITFSKASDSDMKRENANIDGDTAMGMMLRYGSESSKQFYEMYILNPKHSLAHKNGDIHIHDLDFLSLTTTCCQIDLDKLFTGGFSTGHGFLREPNDIASYSALACIAIQSNQNDQHGGQSIPNFDYAMAKGVIKTYQRIYRQNHGSGH